MATQQSFLTAEEEKEVIDAIKEAELNTSGEIRVHIEKGTDTPLEERAKEVFELLEMHKTQLKNGVLVYIAIEKHSFYICGDEGINTLVADNFWDSTKEIMLQNFKQGLFKEGIVAGILKAGEQLKVHFPYQDDDINELPDEISKL
ncbi:TPM domain-containing protein [Neptunitalea lumnitzerae]|uniref:TPM domain-containing protein n=1 Tax=Neptunitalea lumnitzerae TaxID=2965509 RepID=A0ABQ5MF64_9FLAO|nr:TPM domain-containing protein [Neptunitalea sp. Y10]GLB47675.1 hypothetical protein Y10_00430 [Neptunitalea sp. Y10]